MKFPSEVEKTVVRFVECVSSLKLLGSFVQWLINVLNLSVESCSRYLYVPHVESFYGKIKKNPINWCGQNSGSFWNISEKNIQTVVSIRNNNSQYKIQSSMKIDKLRLEADSWTSKPSTNFLYITFQVRYDSVPLY